MLRFRKFEQGLFEYFGKDALKCELRLVEKIVTITFSREPKFKYDIKNIRDYIRSNFEINSNFAIEIKENWEKPFMF